MKTSRFLMLVMTGLALVISTASQAQDAQCKRPELVWQTWRDHVLASNADTGFFELLGDGRDRIVRALNCDQHSDKCPPERVMVFTCGANSNVLVAFVKKGCVTVAEDMPTEEFLRHVTGGDRAEAQDVRGERASGSIHLFPKPPS